MTTTTTVELELTEMTDGLLFPEGPIAMPDGSVVLVEMFGPRLTRVLPDGSKETVAEIEGGPNGAAVGPGGMIFLCNNGGAFSPFEFNGLVLPGPHDPERYFGGRIQIVDPSTGQVTDLYTECDGRPLRAPNDLVMDGLGGFWFTDHGIRDENARTADLTAIYYALCDGSSITEVVFPVDAPNGIGLSPDGKTVYWAETHNGRVHSAHHRREGQCDQARAWRRDSGARRPARVAAARLACRRRRRLGLCSHHHQWRCNGDITGRHADRTCPDRRPRYHEHLLWWRRPTDCLHHAVEHRTPGKLSVAAPGAGSGPYVRPLCKPARRLSA